MNDKLREALAAYAHASWSGWMDYLLSKLTNEHQQPQTTSFEDIRWSVDAQKSITRWLRQMRTSYAELPEKEKESDRVEADKMLEICKAHAPVTFTGWYLGKRSAVKDVLAEARAELKRKGGPTRELDVADIYLILREWLASSDGKAHWLGGDMSIESRVEAFIAQREAEIGEHCMSVDGPEAERAWLHLVDALEDEFKRAVVEALKARGYLPAAGAE